MTLTKLLALQDLLIEFVDAGHGGQALLNQVRDMIYDLENEEE